MALDGITAVAVRLILGSSSALALFKKIANNRITPASDIKAIAPNADADLKELQSADLIGSGARGENYYVTAKGLKVARDLEQIPPVN